MQQSTVVNRRQVQIAHVKVLKTAFALIFSSVPYPPSPPLLPHCPTSLCHCASHPALGLQRYFKHIWEINLTAN